MNLLGPLSQKSGSGPPSCLTTTSPHGLPPPQRPVRLKGQTLAPTQGKQWGHLQNSIQSPICCEVEGAVQR